MVNNKRFMLFMFYFLVLGAVAAHRPYMVLYYQSLDFTGSQIGLLTGIPPLLTIISLPFITGLADSTNRHRLTMNISLLLLILTIIMFPMLETFPLHMVLALVSIIFFSAILPLANSATMFMLGEEKEMYGRIRLGGTIGFSIMATGVGALVENSEIKIAFWIGAGLLFIAFLISQTMEYSEKEKRKSIKKGRAIELLKNPHFLLFLLISFSGGVSFATLATYLFPYMQELGAGESIMGLALTFGTLVEIPVLFFINRFIKRFNAYPLIIFSMVATSLRFFLMAIVPDPTLVLAIQLLNGINYPLLQVAGVTYTDERAPLGFRATAQGLFNVATGGLGAAVGGFIGGILFESIGPRGMFFVFGMLILVVLAFVTIVRRLIPPEQLPETELQPV